jgi:hypothetical protein
MLEQPVPLTRSLFQPVDALEQPYSAGYYILRTSRLPNMALLLQANIWERCRVSVYVKCTWMFLEVAMAKNVRRVMSLTITSEKSYSSRLSRVL